MASSFVNLPHQPHYITLTEDNGFALYTQSDWGSKGIYKTNGSGTATLFDGVLYGGGIAVTADGKYLYAATTATTTLVRYDTQTKTSIAYADLVAFYSPFIGPDGKVYLPAKSKIDPTKYAIYRVDSII